MLSIDPFPAISRHEAKRLLSRWFGKDAVQWDEPFGPVFIQLTGEDGIVRVRRFSWQQAKYLAGHPISRDDVIVRKYPRDWPA